MSMAQNESDAAFECQIGQGRGGGFGRLVELLSGPHEPGPQGESEDSQYDFAEIGAGTGMGAE